MAVKVPNDGSKLDFFTFPGAYTIIYWCSEDYGYDISFALCGDCANDERWRPEVKLAECSADYEHDIECESCGRMLVECWLQDEEELCIEGCRKVAVKGSLA